MIFDIGEVENLIGYSFKDKMLLRQCFTHSSYAHQNGLKDNEVLEFYGDAIMDFLVTEHLYKTEKKKEGELTVIRASIVSKKPLLKFVVKSGLYKHLIFGQGFKPCETQQEKTYSSLFEAIVAGIYIDGGMEKARRFVKNSIIADYENKKKQKKTIKIGDAKSALQEYVQKRKIGSISYQLLSKSGPDHNPTFTVAVLINNSELATGVGGTKKLAETNAADFGLKKLKNRKKSQRKN